MLNKFKKFFEKHNMGDVFIMSEDEEYLYLKFTKYGNTLRIDLKEKKTFTIKYLRKLKDRVLEGIEKRRKKDIENDKKK